jgi:hypothetical protein
MVHVRMLPRVMHMVHDTMMVVHDRDGMSPSLGLRRDRGGEGKGQGGEREFHGEATHDDVLVTGHRTGMRERSATLRRSCHRDNGPAVPLLPS